VLEADPQTKMKTEINVVKLFYCYMKRGTCTMTSKQTLRGYCFFQRTSGRTRTL